jgi:dGTPase
MGREGTGIGEADEGVGELLPGADIDPSTIEARPPATAGVEGLREGWEVRHPNLHPPLNREADQHPVKRDAAHKRLGAVDRIDPPDVRTTPRSVAELLPYQSVAREGGGESLADQRLGAAVGDRHRRRIPLLLDRDVALKIAQGEAPSLLRHRHRRIQETIDLRHAPRYRKPLRRRGRRAVRWGTMPMTRDRLEAAEAATLAPYAALASASRGRRHPEGESSYRTPFQKDRDRVIHTSAFRRLEYKTQVFVNYEGDYYRTRLTHTLEVAQVARSITRALGLNEDLAETVALAHDLGHPPFGHAGERTLDRLAHGVGGFDHNRQSLRIVTELERRYPGFAGLNLTWETLEGIMKHETEYDLADPAWEPEARPSLEAQVVNIADEVAYNAHDLDDGLRSGHLSAHQVAEVPLIGELMERLRIDPSHFDPQGRYTLIRELLGWMINDTIHQTEANLLAARVGSIDDVRAHPEVLVGHSEQLRTRLATLKEFLYAHLYHHYRQIRMTRKADHILERLYRAYIAQPEMLPPQVTEETERLGVERAVVDYLSGMTDRYVVEEYRRLFDPLTLT